MGWCGGGIFSLSQHSHGEYRKKSKWKTRWYTGRPKMAPSHLCKHIRIEMRHKLGSYPLPQHQISANLNMYVDGGTKRDHILREKQRAVMNCFIKKALVDVWPSQTSCVPAAWYMARVQCSTSFSQCWNSCWYLIPDDCILWGGLGLITRPVSCQYTSFTVKTSWSVSSYTVNTVGIHDIKIMAPI